MVLASGFEGDDDALPIRATARVLGATVKAGRDASNTTSDPTAMPIWCRPIGEVEVNGAQARDARDGAALADEPVVKVTALTDAEVVLVDAT